VAVAARRPLVVVLYRHMIPVLVARGHRCIAPDLVGFRPERQAGRHVDYTTPARDWMSELLFATLDLRRRPRCGQDWGGLIGLRCWRTPGALRRRSDRQYRPPDGRRPMSDAFLPGSSFSKESPTFPIGASSTAGARARWTTRWSPRMTRPSPTTPSRRAHGSSRPWCRPRPMTRPTTTTRLRGRCCARSRSRSSARSATRTPSLEGATPSSP